jgi:hypothetical protein
MATSPIYLDGFEDGKIEDYSYSGTPRPELTTNGSPASGQRALEATTPATAGAPRLTLSITNSSIVVVGFRWRPAANMAYGIVQFQNGPRFDFDPGNVINSPTGFDSATMTLNQWYWLSVLIDYAASPGNLTLSWSIDGSAQQTGVTAVDATGTVNQVKFGMIEAQASKSQFFDDIVIHVGDTSDYPVADRSVLDWKGIAQSSFRAIPKYKLRRT